MVTRNAPPHAMDAAHVMPNGASEATPGATDAGALALLLAAEREHVERLAAAGREAEAILADGRAAAARREEAVRREVDAEIVELRRELETDCVRGIAAAAEAAMREAARFDVMTDARIAVLADRLLDHLFSGADDRATGASP